MMNCNTCLLWKPYAQMYPGGWAEDQQRAGGYCLSAKLREDYHADGTYAPDALVYPYAEGAEAFWTGPMFGCVHHTKGE